MPVISFVSPKGGVGKTTSLMVLASGLIANNLSVHIIDADPNYPLMHWQEEGGKAEGLTVTANKDENNLQEKYYTMQKPMILFWLI